MEEEVDLRDYLNMIKKRWKIILGVFLSSIIISVIVSFSLPKVYEVKLMLRIGKVKDEFVETGEITAKVFQSKLVLEEVIKRLNLSITEEKIREIKGKIFISELDNILEVKGQDSNPQRAVELVNVVANIILERHKLFLEERQEIIEKYIAGVEEQLVQGEEDIKNLRCKIKRDENTTSQAKAYIVSGYMDSLEKKLVRYDVLKTELYEKNLEKVYETEPTQIIVFPLNPMKPISPRKKINVLIAVLVGLIVGLGLAGFLEYFEQSAKKN